MDRILFLVQSLQLEVAGGHPRLVVVLQEQMVALVAVEMERAVVVILLVVLVTLRLLARLKVIMAVLAEVIHLLVAVVVALVQRVQQEVLTQAALVVMVLRLRLLVHP